MGTRNLTVVKSGGEYKIAQYCQWDGYPAGKGIDLLHVLRGTTQEQLREAVSRVVLLNAKEVESLWATVGATGNWVDMKTSDEFKRLYPSLHRDNGGPELLTLLLSSTRYVPHYFDMKFAADSLMCEWCYVIDLDEGVLDVYQGFNTEPLGPKERFAFLESETRTPALSGEKYHPVKFLSSFLLDHLPTDREFCKLLDPGDEE